MTKHLIYIYIFYKLYTYSNIFNHVVSSVNNIQSMYVFLHNIYKDKPSCNNTTQTYDEWIFVEKI